VLGGFGINASVNSNDSEIQELTTVDTRALPTPGLGQPYAGNVNKGCTPAIATTGQCFDYTPYTITLSGVETLFAPGITYTIGLDYSLQLSGGGTLVPALSYNYSDSAYSNVLQSPLDNYYRTDERKLTNFSVSYRKGDWDVQFFATNATDELFIEGVNGGASVLSGDPRVYGARVRMTF
jgi:hypothetical protein